MSVTSFSEYDGRLTVPQQLAADTHANTQQEQGLQLAPSRLQLHYIHTTDYPLYPSSPAHSALQEAQAEATSSC